MTEDFTLHQLSLDITRERNMLEQFLAKHQLTFESDIETAFGIFDSDEHLAGCGCAAGSLLKCFAVDETLRGQNALGSLISRLVEDRFESGFYNLFVITRPKNKTLFTSCGFYPLAETDSVLMLENKKNGLEQFYRPFLPDHVQDSETGEIGAIVMNCNPFTKGHLSLISQAASQCRRLHIFVVNENRSVFPFEERLKLVQEGTADFSNVQVHPSGPYIISSATFPTYFLKKGEQAAKIQSELDITLFASRIAPLFSITKRFAGEEPFDPVTRQYNLAMESILPRYGITFSQIPRKSGGTNNEPISASRVRMLLAKEGISEEVLELVPPCTAEYLKHSFDLQKLRLQ